MIPPSPAASFRWQQTAAGAALVCRPLERYARHFFTTLSWKLGSPPASVAEEARWAQVAAEVRPSSGVVRLRQVHGRGVVLATYDHGATEQGDILITGEERTAIAVQAADCVPLLFVDPEDGSWLRPMPDGAAWQPASRR